MAPVAVVPLLLGTVVAFSAVRVSAAPVFAIRPTISNSNTTTSDSPKQLPAFITGLEIPPPDSSCDVSVDLTCYTDLATAIRKAPAHSTVYLNRDGLVVTKQISFSKSLTVAGNPNSKAQVRLYGKTTGQWGAMFRATGNGQTVTLRHIYFERQGTAGSALRTPELGQGDQPEDPTTTIALTVLDCTFNNFLTHGRGGAAIFVGRTSGLRIEGSTFTNNHVPNYISPTNGEQIEMWMGGGAVWVRDGRGPIDILNNHFGNNMFDFKHSLGAALMIQTLTDKTNILGNMFEKNKASAGGALYVAMVETTATLNINSVFKDNIAFNYGWGSRGGAIWLERIWGKTQINGTFTGNICNQGRGGAIANNQVGGSVVIDATFTNNVAETSGALWDSWSNTNPMQPGATFTVRKTTKLSGNRARNGQLIYMLDGGSKETVQYQTKALPTGQDLTLVF